MKTITIQVPDDFEVPEGYEVKLVKKESIKTYQDLIDSDIEIGGYYINELSEILLDMDLGGSNVYKKNLAASEKVAKSMLAMAMISQLMPYYGGEITDEEWSNNNIQKYLIQRVGEKIKFIELSCTYCFLAFHTPEQRDEFLKYNEQLVNDYLMIK